MSEPKDTRSSDGIECPQCNKVHYVEGEDLGDYEKVTQWECEECGCRAEVWAEVSWDFIARPL